MKETGEISASLHIGPWKTGTTSLQAMMNDGRESLLRAGYYYPPGIFFIAGHHELPNWILGSLPRFLVGWSPLDPSLDGLAGALRSISGQTRMRGAHTLVLSSEDFSALSDEGWRQFLRLLRQEGAGSITVTFTTFDVTERASSYASQMIQQGEHLDDSGRRTLEQTVAQIAVELPSRLEALSIEFGLLLKPNSYSKDLTYLHDVLSSVTNADVAGKLISDRYSAFNQSLAPADLHVLNEFNRYNTEGRGLESACPIVYSDDYPFARQRLLLFRDLLRRSRQLQDQLDNANHRVAEVEEGNRMLERDLAHSRKDLELVHSSRTWRMFGWWRGIRPRRSHP